MATDEELVKNAFRNTKYTWRTVRGVAKETGLEPEKVQKYLLSHGDEIVKSAVPNQKGEQLYASRTVYKSKHSPLTRLISAIKNRGG